MSNAVNTKKIQSTLRTYFGFSTFRPLQGDVIGDVLRGHDTFVLMPTGGGKSLCYQLPSLLLPGITIVVSPLIALMKDQVDALTENGVPATYLNSSLTPEKMEHRKRELLAGTFKLLYLAPERLVGSGFINFLKRLNLSLFAIDEAHCISEWGHDFRQDYRQLARLRDHFPDVPIVAMTATADHRVQNDILTQLSLQKTANVYRASFDRPNLFYEVRPKGRGFDQLLDIVQTHRKESGIIYCQSRNRCESMAEFLRDRGYRALPYHAGLGNEVRAANQEKFVRDDVDIICATIAFGMGIDKPDVRFVIHFDLPKNLMGYYQETGRAGRDGLPSDCILFYNPGDRIKIQRFIDEKPERKERAVAMAQLEDMIAYAESIECRRKIVLAYFGEELGKENCASCDNCTQQEEIEMWDATLPAQKLLSCVIRLQQGFGVGYVIDVLKGSEKARILNNRHNLLTTYGIGEELSREEWRTLAHDLITGGVLAQDIDSYNILKVTKKGWDVIRGKTEVQLRRRKKPARATKSRKMIDLPEANQELFQQLRELRKRLADEQGIPAYMIFDDKTLLQLSKKIPRSIKEFLRIYGIGKVKAERYGKSFLDIIIKFIEAHPELVAAGAPKPDFSPPVVPGSARETLELFEKGMTPEDIARSRNLSRSTIKEHFESLIAGNKISDIDRLVPPEKISAIESVFEILGTSALKPVLESLGPESYSYDELKIVRAWIQAKNNREGS